MDMQHIIDEYTKGREVVKEYPNFGVRTILPTKRRKVKGDLLRSRKGQYEIACLTQKRRLKHRKTRSLKKRCIQHLTLPMLSTEEDVALNETVSFIEGKQRTGENKRANTTMNVLIDHTLGSTMCITMSASSTVKDVKLAIEQRIGTPCKIQRLRCQGRPIKDVQCIGELRRGSNDLSLLLFQGQLRGGAPPADTKDEGAEGGAERQTADNSVLLDLIAKGVITMDQVLQVANQGASSTTVTPERTAPLSDGNQVPPDEESPSVHNPTTVSDEDTAKEGHSVDDEHTSAGLLEKCFPCISFLDMPHRPESKEFCLRHIFGRKGPHAFVLEREFDFYILYDPKKLTLEENQLKAIWTNAIQNHQTDWVDLLPSDEKQKWEVLDGKPIEFRFSKSAESSVKAVPFGTSQSTGHTTILLVDDSVVHSKLCGFLSIGKGSYVEFDGHSNKPFHAQISLDPDTVKVTWGDFMAHMSIRSTVKAAESFSNTSEPRRFRGQTSKSFRYQEGSHIDCEESGDEGSLIDPCHEFKLFADAVKNDSFIEKFCTEVLRFACACLNSRKNGTIHFGIADENESNAENSNKETREIVGVPVLNKVEYKDKLTEYINNRFHKENRDFARRCICRPEFILVERKEESSPMLYVIEVDVETSYDYTHGEAFSVALDNKKIHQYFSRRGAQSCVLLEKPSADDMTRLDSKRKDEEIKNGPTFNDRTSQLREALKEDCGKLDKGFKRILVLSSVKKSMLTQDFLDKATVVSNIPWSFIIDFNEETKGEFGLCKALTENTDLRIHHAQEFNNARFRKDQLPEAWVFGNGMGESKVALSWEDWQTSDYLNGLIELIQKSKEEFIPSRTVIFFIIRPGFSKIEAIAYYNFIRHFGKNAVRFYVEDEKTNAKWMKYIVDELIYLDEHKYMVRSIVGLPWGEFCEEVKNLTIDYQRGMIKIPYSENTLCVIARGFFKDKSVQIMDCEESDYLYDLLKRDEQCFERKKLELENNFLSGRSEISMENLWFTSSGATHVITRDVMTELAKCFEYALSNDKRGPVRTIRFLYTRGSGGTTVAMHFLWTLFHREPPFRVRCCIAGKSIMSETVDTIYKFWTYKNKSRLPIVVLLDNPTKPHFDILARGLPEKIECGGVYAKGPAVILLKVESTNQSVEEIQENSNDPNLDAYMSYALSKKENTRFHEKYLDMQMRYRQPGFQHFAEMTLPSFMMRMQRSVMDKKSYAKRFVESALPDVSEEERGMLQFLSLICSCVPDDPHIFTASFDPIMASYVIIKKRYQSNWTSHLGQNAKVFLKFTDLPVSKDAFEGTDEGVAIVLREFAEEILEQTCKHERERINIGHVALQFMNSSAFPSITEISKINEYVRCLYHKMYLALQRKVKTGRRVQSKFYPKFSEFINRVLHIDNSDRSPSKSDLDLALSVMTLGFEKMARPVLAQQVARLAYIHGPSIRRERKTYFDMAEKWIEIALKIRRDSYFLDTAGRIPLRKLQCQFPYDQKRLDKPEDCRNALDLCMESIEWFQESQRAEQICVVWNNASYFGEMQAMYVILTLLKGSSIFQYESDNVRKYVCIEKWQPPYVPWTLKHEQQLKGFGKRYLSCLNKVEEISSILKTEDESDLLEYQTKFKDYYVLICSDEQQDDLARWRQNWMAIQKYIGGGVFKHVFNIDRLIRKSCETYTPVEALKRIHDKLVENLRLNVPSKEKDIFLFIMVKMAMYSPFRCPSLPRKNAVAEFIEAKKNMEILLQHEESTEGKHKSYCLLFSVMFSWPHDHPDMKINPEWEQQYHTALEKLETMSSAMQKTYQKPDQDTGEEFCRRDKLNHAPRYSAVTTLFYLGKGNGLDMYVHLNELPTYRSSNRTNWDHPEVEKRLLRVFGERDTDSIIKITTSDKKVLPIAVGVQWRDSMHSLERVSFYVGFSWKGPIAYDVTSC